MVSYGDLRNWDPGGLSSASTQLRADLKTLEKAKDALEDKTIPDSWSGLAQIFATIRRSALLGQMDDHIEGVRSFERAIYSAQGRVEAIEQLVTDIGQDARTDEFEIGSDGTVTDVSTPGTFLSERAAEAYTQERITLRDALVRRIESVVKEGYDVDSALVHARPKGSFNSEGPQGVVDPDVGRQWAEMSAAERRATLERLAEEIADESGVEDFEVRIEDLEDSDGDGVDDDPSTDAHGSWSEDDRVLRIDANDLDDPDILNTVGHEVRHAAQNQAVDALDDDSFNPPPGATRGDVEDWRDNFDDYQSPEDGFEAYENQPVESDARDAGDRYLDDLTGEDVERAREGGG